jgi:hypothetical protein
MAGAMVRRDYTLESGDVCSTLIPAWSATAQGATADTVTTTCPKNIHYRKRYYRVTATGKEGSVRVMDPASSFYTNPYGTTLNVPTLGSGTATPATLTGRTGGRDKNR